jgi:hypothetical protein
VNGLGELTFAGAAFARDEHRCLGGRDFARHGIHLLHRAARANEAVEAFASFLMKLAPKVLRLDSQVAPLERTFDGELERIDIDRLREVVLGTGAHGGDRRAHLGEGRHDDDGELAILFFQFPKKLDPAHGWHLEVRHHHVGRMLASDVERARPVLCAVDHVAVQLEQSHEACPATRLVVDYEDTARALGSHHAEL